jgi:hypothetical protein
MVQVFKIGKSVIHPRKLWQKELILKAGDYYSLGLCAQASIGFGTHFSPIADSGKIEYQFLLLNKY